MLLEHVAVTLGDVLLNLLDAVVEELDDPAGLEANHVVVMRPVRELKYRRTTLKMVAADQPGLLELHQHSIDRRETELIAALEQQAIDTLCAQMALACGFEDFQHLEAGRSDLESGIAQILSFHVPVPAPMV